MTVSSTRWINANGTHPLESALHSDASAWRKFLWTRDVIDPWMSSFSDPKRGLTSMCICGLVIARVRRMDDDDTGFRVEVVLDVKLLDY
mmetsp:Transcript_17037/g.35400  ORF Transcript_17037/g.35400 Transcript_17037/m.35400 type:complete len:89 (+) Transcript_17037:1290-1556(+)